jgi:hypothetical protein
MMRMLAKEKIEALTTKWYGFALFVGLANLLMNGIGVFSIIGAGMATAFGIVMTWLIGRLLIRGGSTTRAIFVVLSVIGMIGGVLGAGGALVGIFQGAPVWSSLVMSVLMVSHTSMNLSSYRVLTERGVKAYFAR